MSDDASDDAPADAPDIDGLAVEAVTRPDLLDALREGAMTTGDLERMLDCSRSTVHRAVSLLRESGAAVQTDDGYALTGVGRSVAAETRRYRDRLGTAARLGPFLNALPVDAPEPPLDAFADATVTEPDGRRLHPSLSRLRDLVADSDRVRLLSSVISPVYVDLLHEAVLDGARVQAVFDPAVVEIIFEEYAGDVRDAADTGTFEVRIGDDCPFELFVFEQRVALAVHDEAGHLRAFVESSDDDAYAWCERLFDRYHDAADYATVI
ncbi:helix-turn-helix transcriptional regulator [Halomarina salina]|uniref:Helix-turn-helix transcriptional regulator n=1 Tax=Halomarina salina TaxID=1872699 RepID=A0ABD5RNU8_9EURY|nr:HTH domain-containing protein [Halomarina salina]